MEDLKTGQYLRKLREDKNLSLKEIAEKTRISTKVLENLELSNFSNLPKKPYIIGFIKNVCKELGVDSSEALSLLHHDLETLGLDKKNDTPIYEQQKNNSLKSSNKKPIIFLLLTTLGLFSLYKILSKNDPKLINQKTKSTKVITSTTLYKRVILSTTTSMKITTTSSTTTSSTTTTTLKVSVPYVKFKPLLDPTFYVTQNSSDEVPDKYKDSNTAYQQVYFKASNKCWIRYKVDSANIKSRSLKSGDTFFISGRKVFLAVGSFNNLDLYLNGKKVESTNNQSFQTIIFPIDEYTNHYSPLFVDDDLGQTYFYKDYMKLMSL